MWILFVRVVGASCHDDTSGNLFIHFRGGFEHRSERTRVRVALFFRPKGGTSSPPRSLTFASLNNRKGEWARVRIRSIGQLLITSGYPGTKDSRIAWHWHGPPQDRKCTVIDVMIKYVMSVISRPVTGWALQNEINWCWCPPHTTLFQPTSFSPFSFSLSLTHFFLLPPSSLRPLFYLIHPFLSSLPSSLSFTFSIPQQTHNLHSNKKQCSQLHPPPLTPVPPLSAQNTPTRSPSRLRHSRTSVTSWVLITSSMTTV